MNADIQARFDRLDTALTTLIESLTSYNPSTPAAAALVAADDHLADGLELLTKHQRNYQRIVALRDSAQSLDERVKSTLLTLAQTRKDLLNPPAAENEASTKYQLDHDQLLRYAQNIARFTVPPTHRPPLPPSINASLSQQNQQDSAVEPTAATPADASHLTPGGAKDQGKAMASLPTAVKAWLEPASSQMPFVPWPEDATIRTGALGQIEETWTKGLDPAQRDVASEAEAAKREQEDTA